MPSLLDLVRAHIAASSFQGSATPYRPEDGGAAIAFAEATPTQGGHAFRDDPAELTEFLTAVTPHKERWIAIRDGDPIVALLAASASSGPAAPAPFTLLIAGDAPQSLANALVGAVAEDEPHAITIVTAQQRAQREALNRHGFAAARRFSRLHRDLVDIPAPEPHEDGLFLLDGTDIAPRGFSEELRLAHNIAFSDHWGPMTKDPQEWQAYLARRTFDRDLTLVLMDGEGAGSRIAAYALNTRYVDTATGVRVESAHTDYIGVLPPYRGRGLVGILLRELWRRARSAGLSTASLGADNENLHNAGTIYRRLGYREVETATAYVRSPKSAPIASRDAEKAESEASSYTHR